MVVNIIKFMLDLKLIKYFVLWPCFSITSFKMVKALIRLDIIPATLIDVGANIGQFSIASNELYKDLATYAFEPLPECKNTLVSNTKKYNKLSVASSAIGDYTGNVKFYINEHSHSSSALRLASGHTNAFPKFLEKDSIEVAITTLDEYFKEIALKSPVLLKIDVQGYEMNVIKGAIKTLVKVDFVIVEVSFVALYDGESTFSDILVVMSELGFKFQMPVGWLAHPKTKELLQVDALFVNERLSRYHNK